MSARSKIVKPVGQVPDELELQVAQNLVDLEQNVNELKAELRGLQFSSAKEVSHWRNEKWIYMYK